VAVTDSTQQTPQPTEPRRFLIGTYAETRAAIGHCPNAQTWVTRDKWQEPTLVHALRCNQWSCPWCGPRRAMRLGAKCEAAQPTKFITFTCRPSTAPTPREAYDLTRRKLCDLHKKIRTEQGSFEYMRVLEQHRNGYPHYHYVARCQYIPQKWLSEAWRQATGNYIVDIRSVDKRTNVFGYVMKYLCKQSYIPWTNRRVAWSRDFFEKPETPDDEPDPKYIADVHYQHPSTWLTNHHQGQPVIELAPGIWQIDELPENAKLDPPSTN